jgi:hypothetical protein
VARARPYRNPIYAADIRDLQGAVSVCADRDHADGSAMFKVSHVSGGGDIAFLSRPIASEEQAATAAEVLAQFVNAKEVKLAP